MDTSKIVGEKIKSLREDKSITIEELAQRSGLAMEQIERIENNIDIPSLAPLIKIARVLGVRLGTFLDDQDEVGPVVYTEIEDLVREKCSALVYLGLHNEKLHDFFDRFGLPVADVQTGMKDAVEAAYKLAKKGETVLLSPCCASFDLFNSYEDRGDQFKKYVREL